MQFFSPPDRRYEKGCKLSAVIYMHRITDRKVGGTSQKNLNIFRKICGEESAPNVAFVTSMWDEVDVDVGLAREQELATSNEFFSAMLHRGARLLRYENSVESGRQILLQLCQNRPTVLRIQRELVDESKSLTETEAGMELILERVELTRKHTIELADVQNSLKSAKQAKDSRAAQELEEVRRELDHQIWKATDECRRMSVHHDAERRRAHERLEKIWTAMRKEQEGRHLLEWEVQQLREALHRSRLAFVTNANTRETSLGSHYSGCLPLASGAIRLVDLALTIYGDVAN